MHELHFVISGFSTILGPHVSQLAAMCTLLFAVRTPPDYSDDQTWRQAVALFTVLVLMHFALAVVKCHATYVSRLFWDKTSACMLVEIAILAWVCNFEVFVDDPEAKQLAGHDAEFSAWLFLELLVVVTYIGGGALYLLFYHFVAKPRMQLTAPTSQGVNRKDFFSKHMCLIDMLNAVLASAVLCAFITWQDFIPADPDRDAATIGLLNTLTYLGLAQVAVLLFAIFVTRVSEHRENGYNNCMPEIAYYSSLAAMGVFPVLLALLGAGCLLGHYLGDATADELAVVEQAEATRKLEGILGPAITFLVMSQTGLEVNFWLVYRQGLLADFTYWKGKRDAYDAIRTYL